jgi:hypothetical protein
LAFVNKAPLAGAIRLGSPPEIAPDWQLGDLTYHTRRQHAIKLTLHKFGYLVIRDIPEPDRGEFWNSVRGKQKQLEKEGWQPKTLGAEELVKHAAAAVRNFEKAIELDPKNGLYHLGLASLLEQYVQFLRELKPNYVPEAFRSIILDRAKDMYYTAYILSIRDDLKHKYKPVAGLRSLVGYEAGKAYVRLLKADKSVSKDEQDGMSNVEQNLEKLECLPVGAVTPIIFSFEEYSSLSDLLASDIQVSFDLDGDGVVELWPWLKPTTGILVWDPQRKGRITSGRQLFGSVTWWLFFADGYHALDALDDNRDGYLTGYELAGISIWFDRDSDGKSDPGEVVPVERSPIVSVATKAIGKDRDCPINLSGLTLAGGRIFPTYDWTASPIEPIWQSVATASPAKD